MFSFGKFLAILSLVQGLVADEYFGNATFIVLKQRKGQFSSEMQVNPYHSGHQYEQFSFLTRTGVLSSVNSPEHYLYADGRELYAVFVKENKCQSEELYDSKIESRIRQAASF